MIRCGNCGWIGESDELKVVYESRGEFWGIPCSERMCYCPSCGDDYLEDYNPEEPEDDEDESGYWVSYNTQYGDICGTSIQADTTDELFRIFNDRYPECEICDYGRYGDEE